MGKVAEQVNEPRASGIDPDNVTKEQLASMLASLSQSVSEFVSVASPLLVKLASDRKESENATSGQ